MLVLRYYTEAYAYTHFGNGVGVAVEKSLAQKLESGVGVKKVWKLEFKSGVGVD